MADAPRKEPLTYPGEVPVEDWVVDFQGDMEESSPIRYVSHEEFLRKKAGAKLQTKEPRHG